MISRTFSLVVALSTGASAASVKSPDIAAAYQGTWQAHLIEVSGPYSNASDRRITIENSCSSAGADATCKQSVDGEPTDEVRYIPTREPTVFDVVTTTLADRSETKGTLWTSGRKFTYPWTEQRGPDLIFFKVENVFTGPNAILYAKYASRDGHRWTRVASGSERRLPSHTDSRLPPR